MHLLHYLQILQSIQALMSFLVKLRLDPNTEQDQANETSGYVWFPPFPFDTFSVIFGSVDDFYLDYEHVISNPALRIYRFSCAPVLSNSNWVCDFKYLTPFISTVFFKDIGFLSVELNNNVFMNVSRFIFRIILSDCRGNTTSYDEV
jgi:hypothetical protein